MMKRLGGLTLALGALAVAMILLAGVLTFDALRGGPHPRVSAAAGSITPTAREALDLATGAAKAWAVDAELAGARGHVTAVGSTSGGQAEWTFQFFSPSGRRIALFVPTDVGYQKLRDQLSPYQVPIIPASAWRVGSEEALRTWASEGGDYLLERRSDHEIVLRLFVHTNRRDSTRWAVSGSASGTESTFEVQMDAEDGRVVVR